MKSKATQVIFSNSSHISINTDHENVFVRAVDRTDFTINRLLRNTDQDDKLQLYSTAD